MKPASSKKVIYPLLGLLCGLTLAYLGMVSSGGGHSNLTMMLALAPYGLGLLFWPILGFLAVNLKGVVPKRLFLGLMGTHYLGLLFYIYLNWESELYWLARAVKNTNFIIFTTLCFALYFIGQCLLWLAFLRQSRRTDMLRIASS